MTAEPSKNEVNKSEWLKQSTTFVFVFQLVRGVRAVRRYFVSSVVRTLSRWGRSSLVYSYLTAEPPEGKVVINLQDARTLRPFLWLLWTTTDTLRTHWTDSVAYRLTRWLQQHLDEFTDSFVGSALVSLLTPPDRTDEESPDSEAESTADDE